MSRFVYLCAFVCLVPYLGFSQAPPPRITGVSPLAGLPGDQITITGHNFSPSYNKVFFGLSSAKVISEDTTTIIVSLPANTPYGKLSVLNAKGIVGESDNSVAVLSKCSAPVSRKSFKGNVLANSPATFVQMADLDMDSHPEVITCNSASGGMTAYLNQGKFAFSPYTFGISSGYNMFAAGDLTGDGLPEVIAFYPLKSTLEIYQNGSKPGTLSFTNAKIATLNGSALDIKIQDMDGDGLNDIVVLTPAAVYIYPNSSVGGVINLASVFTISLSGVGTSFDIADLNQDFRPDIVVANNVAVTGYVNTSSPGKFAFSNMTFFSFSVNPLNLRCLDFNGDKLQDFIVTIGDTVYVSKNTTVAGKVSFAAPSVLFYSHLHNLQPAYLTGDDTLDYFGFNSSGINVIGNAESAKKGIMLDGISFPKPGNFTGAVAADLDLDGKEDLVFVNGQQTGYLVNDIGEYADPIQSSGNTTLCPGTSITLNAGGRFTSFKWTDNSTNQLLSVTKPGKYAVQVTNGCGTYSSDTVYVADGVNLKVTPDKVNPLCPGDSVTFTVGGNISGNCLDFKGNQSAIFPAITLSSVKAFTLEAWVFPKNLSAVPNQTIIKQFGGNYSDFSLDFSGAKSTLRFSTYLSQMPYTVSWNPPATFSGIWHHIVASYDQSYLRLFVDGKVVDSIPASGYPTTYSKQACIGSFNDTGAYFNGLIDEVRFWNVNRTQSQIQALATHAPVAGMPGLIAYFNFDEGTGLTTYSVPGQINAAISDAGMWAFSGAPLLPDFSVPTTGVRQIDSSTFRAVSSVKSVVFNATNPYSNCQATSTLPVTEVNVNAGKDTVLCTSSPSINLNGSVSMGTGNWSGGAGTYNPAPPTGLSPSYTFAASEKTNGVYLYLASAANTACKDTLYISFIQPPTVNLGPDKTLCADTASLQVKAVVSNALVVNWQSLGAGSLTVDTVAHYKIAPADLLSGVSLIARATSSACSSVTDTVKFTFQPLPIANAGPDRQVCVSNTSIPLSGSVKFADGGAWSGGSGTLMAKPSSLKNIYTATGTEVQNGSVALTLTTLPTGVCKTVSDQVVISFVGQSSVFAGNDTSLCRNENLKLNGQVSGALGGKWSGSGTFNPNVYALDAVYVPTSYERMHGAAITLTTFGPGTCSSQTDTLNISFVPGPIAVAGDNQSLKDTNALQGLVKNATGGMWSSSGTGTFSPNPSAMNATYISSPTDLTLPKVTLMLTTTGNGNCSAAVSSLDLTQNAQVCNVSVSTMFNSNIVTFLANNQDNLSLGSYQWDFGDGHTASGKIQSNVFNNAGAYVVSLTYTTPDSSCTSQALDTILISTASIPTYQISGIVKVSGQAFDEGKANLFRFDGRHYLFDRNQYLYAEDSGNYLFDNLENGYYLVHILPALSSAFFNSFNATYYGDTIDWQGATFIQVNNGDENGKNINLVPVSPYQQLWNGTGGIDGKIVLPDTSTGGIPRLAGSTDEPVENAVVTLYNSSGNRLTSTYTDPFGDYSFDSLSAGNYTVDVEYPGTNISDSTSISVSSDARSQADYTAQQSVTGVRKPVLPQVMDLVLYPNPATERLYLKIPVSVQDPEVLIYNQLGEVIYRENLTDNFIPTVYFLQGEYLIKVIGRDNVMVGKFFRQ